MKSQHFILSLAILIFAICAYSCTHTKSISGAGETTSKKEVAASKAPMVFVLPEEMQKGSKEEIMAYIRNLHPQEAEKLAMEYQNRPKSRGTEIDAMPCLTVIAGLYENCGGSGNQYVIILPEHVANYVECTPAMLYQACGCTLTDGGE
ncbi:MAG: hypothetical protein GC192_20100 [Bacteroidetes bacterium]|nr:hypothetical protein [Bacteroidota bacterium]